MKPTNNQFVAGRVASRIPSLFSAHYLAVVPSFILSAVSLRAEETSAEPGASAREKLERQMAADIKAKNWNAVENTIAGGFQSVHPDRPRDRAGEIALLKQTNFGDFAFSNFNRRLLATTS